jgi:hypothetical protein
MPLAVLMRFQIPPTMPTTAIVENTIREKRGGLVAGELMSAEITPAVYALNSAPDGNQKYIEDHLGPRAISL